MSEPIQEFIDATSLLCLHTLPEIALDENPDNFEAEQALSLLTNQISSDLFHHLKSISSTLQNVVSGLMENFEEVFWHRLVESDINPKAMMVFLNFIAKVSPIWFCLIITRCLMR